MADEAKRKVGRFTPRSAHAGEPDAGSRAHRLADAMRKTTGAGHLHQAAVADVISSLETTSTGLTTDEAVRRKQEYGVNRIEGIARRPLLRRLIDEFVHFFALVLWAAAALAVVAEVWRPGEGMLTLAVAIVAVIIVNGLFSFWQEYRSEKAIDALLRILPATITAWRDGSIVEIPVVELVPGDIVQLKGGDIVPGDCRIISAVAVQVNTAAITGESVPLTRDAAPSSERDLVNSANILLAGTAITGGEATAVVFATGMRTVFGDIAHLTQQQRPVVSPLQREVARLSRIISILAICLGAACFAASQALGMPLSAGLLFGVGIIVANVPEGLLPTVTMALAMAAQRLARRNLLVRHLPAVEALGSVTVICTDKTGTLTENEMTVEALFTGGRQQAALDVDISATEHALLVAALRHCHSLTPIGSESGRLSGDPIERALVAFAGGAPGQQPRVDLIPFDSSRRRMTSVHRAPEGDVVYVKGALESVLPCCSRYMDIPLTDNLRFAVRLAEEKMAADGLHVVAVAGRRLAAHTAHDRLEEDLELFGLIGLRDPVRAEVPGAVGKCRTAGIRVIMITGDHPATAQVIAKQAGLVDVDPHVVTGDHLQRLSDVQLQILLDRPNVIFARARVDQKRRIVRALQRKGNVVAVTGDGINDAPALRAADVGIAMGRTGTEVARQAADLILADDNFATIVTAIEEGRAIFDNIRKFLTYILTSNIPEIIPFLAFALFDVPLALTVIQILAIDLGTDIVPGLALGAEPPEPRVMLKPPRDRRRRLVDWRVMLRAYGLLGPQQALAAMTTFFLVLVEHGWTGGSQVAPDHLQQAQTATLVAIVVVQIANLIICRSSDRSILATMRVRNLLVPIGICGEIALVAAIVYTNLGAALIGTAPLMWWQWLIAVPFALLMMMNDEAAKAVRRQRKASTSSADRP